MVMSGWRKALGQLHVCVSASSGDNGRYIATDNGADTPAPPPIASSSNTAALLSPRFSSKLRSSQLQYTRATCAICLELMKPGHGHALFTAECSHTFHFSCIASNVRYGSLVCPVCRSTWKDVPWQAPTLKASRNDPVSRLTQRRSNSVSPRRRDPSAPTSPTSATSTVAAPAATGQPQQRRLEPVLRMLDESIAQFRSAEEREKQMAELDPPTFDDDEQLESSTPGSDGVGFSRSVSPASTAAMQITAVAEESEVPFYEERERMTILINVKAAAARDEEKQIATMLGSSGNVLQLDRSSQAAQQQRRAAVDLVAVLDVSSSMAGAKLSLLKRAMHLVVRSLGPADRLSVVAFASKPRRVMPLRRMTEEGRRAALDAIESLACTAGTSIAEALRKATAILQHRRYRNPVATIMLLSDGQDASSPTHRNGPQSGNVNSALSGRAQFQIPVHTFGGDPETPPGVGGGVSLIQGDVAAAAGNPNPNMQDAFARCLGGLLNVVAVRVELEVQVVNSATNRLLDVESGNHTCQLVAPGRHVRITLGDLYAHEEHDLLVNIHLGALRSAAPRGETLLVLARYYDPVTGAGLQTATTQVLVHRPVQVTGAVRPAYIDVERHRNRLQTARAIVQTRFLVDVGDLRAAQRSLETARSRLQSSAAFRCRDRLSIALDAELARILSGLRGRTCAENSVAQSRSSSRPRGDIQVVEVNSSRDRSLRSRAQMAAAAAAAVANVAAGGGSAPQSPRRRHILAPRPGSRLARLASFDSVIRP